MHVINYHNLGSHQRLIINDMSEFAFVLTHFHIKLKRCQSYCLCFEKSNLTPTFVSHAKLPHPAKKSSDFKK